MLRELHVQDFAIIDQATLSFSKGLTVLTGETGAGKSILVDALGILLGDRLTQDHIRSGCNESRLEALFDLEGCERIHDFLQNHGIPCEEDQLLVRRILARSGKSRSYLNDQLVTISTLQEISEILIDLHGQHDHQSLLQVRNHLDHLDAYEGSTPERKIYQGAFLKFKVAEEKLRHLTDQAEKQSREKEEMEYQAREIEEARLGLNEEEALIRQRNILKNARELIQWVDESYTHLDSEESGISQIQKILSNLNRIQQIDPHIKDLSDLTESALAQLEEVHLRLRDYKSQLEFDPQRLEEIEERLFLLHRLKMKYGENTEEILLLGQKLREDLSRLETLWHEVKAQRVVFQVQIKDLIKKAKALSTARFKKGRALEKHMERELASLRMEKCQFKVKLKTPKKVESENLTPTGIDEVQFLISSNIGEEVKPLAHIASGGELSRMMLALRTPEMGIQGSKTLIFDEVDAGLGGAVAEAVGGKLRKLSQNFQVLCITHLPQIASQADTHFVIQKGEIKKRTITQIHCLNKDQRINEIARMLGGKKMTPTVMEHAREMLGTL